MLSLHLIASKEQVIELVLSSFDFNTTDEDDMMKRIVLIEEWESQFHKTIDQLCRVFSFF